MPQLAHDSRRIGVGYAVDSASQASLALEGRLALHDLADPVAGYPELSQLEFLATRAHVRIQEAGTGRRFQLDSLSLVRVTSLTPRGLFNRKLSWHVDLGVTRLEDAGCAGYCYAARAAFGTGLTFATSESRVALFALFDGRVLSGPALDGIASLPVRVGVGPSGGLRLRATPRIVSLTTAEWIWLPVQKPFATWEVRSILRAAMTGSLALDLDAVWDIRAVTARVAALLYF